MVAAELSVELYKYQMLVVFWRFFGRSRPIAKSEHKKNVGNLWFFINFLWSPAELSVELYKYQTFVVF